MNNVCAGPAFREALINSEAETIFAGRRRNFSALLRLRGGCSHWAKYERKATRPAKAGSAAGFLVFRR
jgi:hypothetical protein